MAYLIDQLVWWLLLAAAFSALAGWAYGAMRAEAETQRLKRERERVLREFVALAGDAPDSPAPDLNVEFMRQRTDVTESRARELEQAIEALRARADAAELRASQAERDLGAARGFETEAKQLRAALENAEAHNGAALNVVATPIDDEALQLQVWRLRYFEQRAAYLERQSVTLALPAPSVLEADPIPLLHTEWRARFAEAAADELLAMAREPKALVAPAPAPSPEAIEAEQRRHWRMLYLERRVHHLQGAVQIEQPKAPEQTFSEDEARRVWRQTYLEQRVAHLRGHASAMQTPESDQDPTPEPILDTQPLIAQAEAERAEAPAIVVQPVVEAEEAPPPQPEPLVPRGSEQRPSALAAPRNGAPDDFTLIDGVSPMQQSTLHSIGVYHFDQIAAWTPANIAWVDQYLRLRGRISDEEWVEQAQDLARGHGVARAERVAEDA